MSSKYLTILRTPLTSLSSHMLTYEQCKALKDAGFPQKGEGQYIGNVALIKPEDFSPDGVVGIAQEDFAYLPSLSELIEACGNDFSVLQLADMRRNSKSRWYSSSCGQEKGKGSTPESAVCNLFLTLKGT